MAEQLAIPTPAGTFDALGAGPEDGRSVLLLHGFPEDASQSQHQLAALAGAGCRGVAFDQRGYSPGVRPKDVAAYGPEQLIGDVLAVADALGWERLDLIGHDWGSAVAWMTAAAHPERLRTLNTVSTPHGAAMTAAIREDSDQRDAATAKARFSYHPHALCVEHPGRVHRRDSSARRRALRNRPVPLRGARWRLTLDLRRGA